ncbi:DUF3617 domain-containing protein [Roseateles cellulosilyticus]|uniref:DUF3617 domain-containing protein n=1 Tax=Pelomonas cellulosilytica TaxID=2906762 RepID=A0ABS8Y305_9BURK|nr:DUF3617 family protein [Pelomonas sp. P8]MCE4558100.1 DUF3617 domain-containing protein [Pelomonas sp. P8]
MAFQLSHAVARIATLCALATSASAAPVIQVNPGLWASESEIWINGQPLKPGLDKLRAKVRSGLTDAQKAELDRAQAAERQACLTPQQSRIDLAAYLESTFRDAGPWKCEVDADKLDGSAASGRYVCRTDGGGLSQGKFSATYGPTSYRLELNGRGNAVDGRTGAALGGGDMDLRMLATGKWLGSNC